MWWRNTIFYRKRLSLVSANLWFVGVRYNSEDISEAKSATKTFEELSIFSELLLKKTFFCIIEDGPFIMQIYNGKQWISYIINFALGRDGCLVMQIAIMGMDGSNITHIGAFWRI